MTQDRPLTARELQVLKVVANGHPDRKVTMTRRGGVSAQVAALTWSEIQVAVNATRDEIHECLAHLGRKGLIESGQTLPSIWGKIKGEAAVTYSWISPAGEVFLRSASTGAEAPALRDHDVDKVKDLLRALGFEITPHGIGVAAACLLSDYSPAETASYLALATIAIEMKSENDLREILKAKAHLLEVGNVLKQEVAVGRMREELFKNDFQAMLMITKVGPDQLKWIGQILADPLLSTRVAYRR